MTRHWQIMLDLLF